MSLYALEDQSATRSLLLNGLGLGLRTISTLDLLSTSSLLLRVTSDSTLGLLHGTLGLCSNRGLLRRCRLLLSDASWLAGLGGSSLLWPSLGTSIGSRTLLRGSGRCLGDGGKDSRSGVSGR